MEHFQLSIYPGRFVSNELAVVWPQWLEGSTRGENPRQVISVYRRNVGAGIAHYHHRSQGELLSVKWERLLAIAITSTTFAHPRL